MGKNKLNVQKAMALKTSKPNDSQNVDEQEVVGLVESPQQLYDPEDTSTSAYLWLLVFSCLMFTFPFLTFYGVRSWLDEAFEFSTFQNNCFSVLASVLVVNFIICLYVFKAFSERISSAKSQQQQPTMKENQDSKKQN